MWRKQSKREKALQKEWKLLEKELNRLERSAIHAKPAEWKTRLEQKVPEKVCKSLEAAFCKGFSLVFEKGRVVIEHGFDREDIRADHAIRDYAVQVKGGSRELKALRKGAKGANLANLTMTTVEGIGLGALGIGMPDIVLFLGTLLKGIYETALHYGFDYESRREQMLILKMMSAALSSGSEWSIRNWAVTDFLEAQEPDLSDEAFRAQMEQTASAFAVDMLLLKFIQGLPVVGILGGAANPLYYNKVLNYVQLQYRKRYLQGLTQKSTALQKEDI